MTTDGQAKLIAAEVAAGHIAFREAEVLRTAGLVGGALGRAYFGAVHFARALLASKGLEAKSHRGLKALLGLHFVQTGILDVEFSRIYARLETWRDESDYNAGFVADAELLDAELAGAYRFRDRILELLRAAGMVS